MPEMASVPPDKSITIPVIKPSFSSIVQNFNSNPVCINPPVSPRTAKMTFNILLEGDIQQEISELPAEMYQNHPASVFYTDEIVNLAEKLKWKLVGKFNKMPAFEKVKSYFQKLQLSGSYQVQWYNYRHIFIKLSNEFDYATIRRRPVVDFDEGHRMRVLKWSTNFSPAKESSIVPVWITFPFLSNHLYNKHALRILAKTMETPLQLDDPTANGTRPSHPRVCIEYDCLKHLPEQIFVHLREKRSGLNKDGFWQKVIFEKIPRYCTHCNILGHEMASCKIFSETQKFKSRKVEEERNKTEAKDKPNENRNIKNNGKVNDHALDKLQPLEKPTENLKMREGTPFLTENWEIGNRRRGKEEAIPREGKVFHAEPSYTVTHNTFTVLEGGRAIPEMENEDTIAISNQEKQREVEKPSPLHDSVTNREASIPGSSNFEVEVNGLLESGKRPDGFLKKGEKPPNQDSVCEIGLSDSANKTIRSKLEDLVIVEDVFDEEETETPMPESVTNLPEMEGGSDKEKIFADISNHPISLSEFGQVCRGVGTGVGVAQERNTEKGGECAVAVSLGDFQGREWAVASGKIQYRMGL